MMRGELGADYVERLRKRFESRVPGAFTYRLDCLAAVQAGAGSAYCAGHIGCGGGCSGSSGDGDSSSGDGCGGGGCGGD